MTVTVGIVSPGFMGAGLGAALRAGGARVVATLDGRTGRTGRLAEAGGVELLPSLADVVAAAGVVLSVVPPGRALTCAASVAEAAREVGAAPVVADLNAVSPQTMAEVARLLDGLPVVDGAISGPPPTAAPGARIFLSGADAPQVAELPWDGQVEPVVLDAGVGAASAVKMCTASVYKGLNAIVTQAIRTGARYGVLDQVLTDLAHNGLDRTAGVARAATKAQRYADEMREIAAAQAGAGLTPTLFAAIAEVYAEIAGTALAEGDPESAADLPAAELVARLDRRLAENIRPE
jgi:3-hydroxyisobutyrate dehydrogenase-like beta-hydroxyacid dehydrogenase